MTTVLRGTTLTPFAALRDIARLLEVFNRPKQWPADNESVARMFVEICGDVSAEQFAQGVTAWVRGDHRFPPTPGQLRAIAHEQRGLDVPGADPESWESWTRRGWCDARGALAPCPVCGRAWQAHPRVTLVHDHAKHRAVGLPCELACDEMGCLGTYNAPPTCPPVAVSAGELWVPPDDWSSDLRKMQDRREAIRARVASS